MKCTLCNNGLQLKAEYTQAGPHLKMTCKLCKQFIKFVKKEDVVELVCEKRVTKLF